MSKMSKQERDDWAEFRRQLAAEEAKAQKEQDEYTAQVLRERAEQKVKDDAYWAKRDEAVAAGKPEDPMPPVSDLFKGMREI